ncbi:MAG: YihY/virulence factor BrkB family protein [Clostridiales bacterium]|jgi:membrane protein|nr:YihY/virulence factor BrkB family protein [Clostridiales bacterium]
MHKFFGFIWELQKDVRRNEVLPLATQLTYRLIFALFPFLIFLIALVGYFDIEPSRLMADVSAALPEGIAEVVNEVIDEVFDTRNPAILSGGLFLSLFTAINGFRAVMRGVNRVYEQGDKRNILKQWGIAALLMLISAAAITLSILVLNMPFGLLLIPAILIFAIILIYRLANGQKHRLKELLPGAALTVIIWIIATAAFNWFINNFSNLSLVYGGVASVFIAMLWLNIISITILLGAQLNVNLKAK